MRYNQQPRAFNDNERQEFWLRRLLWAILTGFLLAIIGWQMKIFTRFINGNFIQKNSVRFCSIMFVIFVLFATYLLIMTKGRPSGTDRAAVMQQEYPIAAYSMTITALLMLIGSFNFFTELLGPLGIVFFFAFWGFLVNILFVFSF